MWVAVPNLPPTSENVCMTNRCEVIRTQILVKLFGPKSLVNRIPEAFVLA